MNYEALIQKAEEIHQTEGARAASPLWQRAVIERPDDWRGIYGLGSAYAETESDDAAALIMLTRAVDVSDGAPEPLTALGSVLRRVQDPDTARWCYQQALKKVPDYHMAVLGMAGSYVNQGNPEKGIPWARRAVDMATDEGFRTHAVNDLALLLLEAGQWAEGWEHYSQRYKLPHYHCRDYGEIPQWDGVDKVGTLAIHAEQGLGDEIMFASCLREAAKYAKRVVVEVNPRLVTLFQRSFSGMGFYGCHSDVMQSMPDAWCRLADLLRLFRPSPDSCPGVSYIRPDPAKILAYRERLKAAGPGPYVGFAWLGGTVKTHEKVRRAPIELWKSLIEKCPGTPVSLQYGEDGAWHAQDVFKITHWQKAIDDLDEFAALIAALDLVVTSPQTAVHFAGAIGARTWCVAPSKSAWRYGMKGERMPFYGSVKMMRQEGDDWKGLFTRLEAELADFGRLQETA